MNKITFPLEHGMQGPNVADLHNALFILLEKSIILPNNEAARKKLSAGLQLEHETPIYGDITFELVSLFRQQFQLEEWTETMGNE